MLRKEKKGTEGSRTSKAVRIIHPVYFLWMGSTGDLEDVSVCWQVYKLRKGIKYNQTAWKSRQLELSAGVNLGTKLFLSSAVSGQTSTLQSVSEHLQAIRGSVESLAALEWQAQTSFNLLL
eukprot:1139138-Pelagomonas_calceolata.AAC.1